MSLGKIDLTTFFLSISQAAFMSLQDEKRDLLFAQQNIELLELMRDKTQGNRTAEEDRLLEQLLFETRMKYVEASQGNR
jgi:hypothetical protein